MRLSETCQLKEYGSIRLTGLFISTFILCIVVLSFQTITPGCCAQTTENTTIIREKEGLFALIVKLENTLPFKGNSVEKLIGRSLIVGPEYKEHKDSNSHLHTTEDKTGFLSQVWVREAGEFTAGDQGGVTLDINPNMPYITRADIVKEYGKESSIYRGPKGKEATKQLVVNYNYERPWGTLTFQGLQKEPNVIRYVIFNTYIPFPCGGILDTNSSTMRN